MKKSLLLLLLMTCCLLPAVSQTPVRKFQKVHVNELKQSLRPNDVSFLAVPERVEGIVPQTPAPKRPARIAKKQMAQVDEAVTDTVQFFALAQSFHKNYMFNYDGGEVYAYNIGVAINGTKATLTNLFDMYAASADAWARSYDFPVDGVYDAEAKTITIPTTEAGIVCGDYGGYYNAILLAGTVSENGALTPSEELVFNVTCDEEGQVNSLTAASHFCVKYDYGTIRVYKSFTANVPDEQQASLVTFAETVDFGEAYVRTAVDKSITLFNRGGMDADFVIELEAEDDAFTTTALTGTVPAQGSLELPFTFKAPQAGSYEGIAALVYDTGGSEASMVFDLSGSAKEYPDYSAAFKSDHFEVTTNIEYPFEMDELEDGTAVARSGLHGQYGQSWLNLAFSVPEGKIGTVSWKGMSNNNSNWYMCAGGFFVDTLDGSKQSFTGTNEDISGEWEFAPGDHFVRFQYDGYNYTGLEENNLYVYDIAYTEKPLAADSVVVISPEIDLGNDMLAAGATSMKNGAVILKNVGANTLTVKNVSSSSDELTADLSGVTGAATMEELQIPVTLETEVTGEKEVTLTIETSAGTVTALVKANIMAMPDYSSLVTEGAEYITGWEVNPDAPFVIKDGKAVNLNAGKNDVYETAWFKMNLSVPEGKLAYVSWDGHSMGRPENNEDYSHYYSSYATFEMSHPMSTGNTSVYGSDVNAGSSYFEAQEYWADYLACTPGNHYYKWGWFHNGDGIVPEGDCVEISNIRIRVIDFAEKNVELLTPEVVFDTIYVGYNRYTTAVATLRNTGSSALTVDSISGNAPFYGIDTQEVAQFNKTINVTLWFFPSEAGEFTGDLTLYTSAGEVKVSCKAVGRDAQADGYIYLGDFEDDAYGWSVLDNDKDGETWDLGTNLWGQVPQYCHSGKQCLASVSYSNYLGAVTPDNWTFSPVITLPAEGGQLSYYVAAFSPYRYEEHYSLYVQEYDEETFGVEEVLKHDPVISETLTEENGAMDGWSKREYDLKDYAGKRIVLCFRHHDCNGQYLLRLDDVNVKANPVPEGIGNITATGQTKTEWFSLDGRRVNHIGTGIYLERTTDNNGRVTVRKVLKK
ncbi:MAG: choice-of-anchor J domain-containing protein [Alloprevotella sp.]